MVFRLSDRSRNKRSASSTNNSNNAFCRNSDNVTGLCSRQSCPLANSRYATIKEEEGKCYLFIKTIERAHSPRRLWEKKELPKSYLQALKVIDKELEYFPKFQVHKNKQRLTKIHQMLIRMRRIKLDPNAQKLMPILKKVERVEAKRERKALSAANLEKNIQSELLNRLKEGTYGDIYNYPAREYEDALDDLEHEEEGEEEFEERAREQVEYVAESESESELEEEVELEDLGSSVAAEKVMKRRGRKGSVNSEVSGISVVSERTENSGVSGYSGVSRLSEKLLKGALPPRKKKQRVTPVVEVEYEYEEDGGESNKLVEG